MFRFCLVLLLAISGEAAAQSARIATWNLGGFNAIPERKLNKIIDGLRLLDADIVVLPEINPLSHAATIAERLSEDDGACFRSAVPDQPRARQEIGFVFKCSVTVSDPGLIEGSDLGLRGYRNAAIADVRIGDFDFVLIGVHQKAGRGSSDRGWRNEQNAYISGLIQGLLRSGVENDILVVGDYNMIPGQDAENFEAMNGDGSLRFVSSESLADGFTHIKRNGRPGNLLDGYAFTDVDQAEYREDSIEIVSMHELLDLSLREYGQKVTDHLPVVAVFDTATDHD